MFHAFTSKMKINPDTYFRKIMCLCFIIYSRYILGKKVPIAPSLLEYNALRRAATQRRAPLTPHEQRIHRRPSINVNEGLFDGSQSQMAIRSAILRSNHSRHSSRSRNTSTSAPGPDPTSTENNGSIPTSRGEELIWKICFICLISNHYSCLHPIPFKVLFYISQFKLLLKIFMMNTRYEEMRLSYYKSAITSLSSIVILVCKNTMSVYRLFHPHFQIHCCIF